MSDKEIRKQVDEFVKLPRAERRTKFFELPPKVRARARQAIEKRRGIAYRNTLGEPVFTQEEYLNQLKRLKAKKEDYGRRETACGERMVELEAQLKERYGDEALKEAKAVLKTTKSHDGVPFTPKSNE